MFLLVPERKPLHDDKITPRVVKTEIAKLFRLIRNVGREKNTLYCLLANFLAVDAVNTAIIFFTTFLENAVWNDASIKDRTDGVFVQVFA